MHPIADARAGMRIVIGFAAAVALAGAGWSSQEIADRGRTADEARSCGADARAVEAGTDLQSLIERMPDGSVLCLSPGDYEGPLELRTRLTIEGPAEAVIHSNGGGTTLRVLADDVLLRGFTVDGSGRRYDLMDAAVYLHGDSIVVEGLTVRHALFGVVAEQSNDLVIEDNTVFGLASLPVGIRGDGIRLWEVRGSTVTGNHLQDSRDILVWYSPGNRIAANTVERSRYATHFMYSDDCIVEGNKYRGNIVGVFVMYSRDIVLRGNVLRDNSGSEAMGLGVKESGNLVVESNDFILDHTCIYLETSPFRMGDSVVVRGNTIAGCGVGVTFHSSETNNAFVDNVFQSNTLHVAVEGRGTAQGVTWRRNYFDDYGGYDLDGDGVGDVAYEPRALSERMVTTHPQLAFFRGTLALALLDLAADVFPILQPVPLFRDPSPRMAPPPSSP